MSGRPRAGGDTAPADTRPVPGHVPRLRIALALAATYLFIETAAALLTGAPVVLSDTGHTLTDAAGLAMAWAAISLAGRWHPRRHRREFLAPLAKAPVVVAVAAFVLYEAVGRFARPVDVPLVPLLVTTTCGLALNAVSFHVLHARADECLDMRSLQDSPATSPRSHGGHPSVTADRVLRPDGRTDLRGQSSVRVLHYAADAIVVVTGLPGAGKSTLMRRCARATLADSQTVRDRWAARLPAWIGYPFYRPLVRLEHYGRLRQAVHTHGPLVVHDSGVQRWVRQWLAREALRDSRPVHLLVLAVSENEALAGQAARGRRVTRFAQARHMRAARVLGRGLSATGTPPPGFASVVLIDRTTAATLQEIRFDATPDSSA